MATFSPPAKRRITVRLPKELIDASQEAVTLGIASSPSAFIEEAVRRHSREVRHARMRVLAQEAMNDPGFVADMRETMQAFQYVDGENEPDA